MNGLVAAGASFLLLPVLVIAAAMGGEQTPPSTTAIADIPPTYLALYEQAATRFGLPWELLAAVGKVETDHGRNPNTDQPNSAGAIGPMQFEPATFAQYNWAAGDTTPNIDDPHDAIFSAAAMLQANGAPQDTQDALYAYNHAQWYVDEVLSWATSYTNQAALSTAGQIAAGAAPAATTAINYALAQLGTPYVWGGESEGHGFDCSGLTQAAYQAAGITIPRVAQAQYDAGPHVPDGQPLQPGDLVFFGTSTNTIDHVGIVLNNTEMIDAPHTGAYVRQEPFPTTIGAPYGHLTYLGATRPTAT